jgi:hypothetical protein
MLTFIRSTSARTLFAGAGVAALLLFILFTLRKNVPTTVPLAGEWHQGLLDTIVNSTLGVSVNLCGRYFRHQLTIQTQFQKIYVINLPSRTDHRDATSLAAACTNLTVEYVPGVTDVDERYMPPGNDDVKLNKGGLGNWRAHMNIARTYV